MLTYCPVLRSQPWDPFSDILVETVPNDAKDTIVFFEKDDHTVGGPIHYFLLRSGHNAKKGILRS